MSAYLVDECFRAEVEAKKWCRRRDGYLSRAVGRGTVLMHQHVWQLAGRPLPELPLTIDHINSNPSDNRLENLRIATQRLQNLNQVPKARSSGLPRGVLRSRKRYMAQIGVGGKSTYIGSYDTPEEASAAYEEARGREIAKELEVVSQLSKAPLLTRAR
jgi:hypothetical protein